MAQAYGGGRVLGVEYREVSSGQPLSAAAVHTLEAGAGYGAPGSATRPPAPTPVVYTNVPMPSEGQVVAVVPAAAVVGLPTGAAPEHYPTSDGYASPYEGLRTQLNRNPFFKSYYDLPADLRTAANPPGDYVVLESQPELRYMLTGPPAQEPTVQAEYGKPFEFQRCRLRVTQARNDAADDEHAPAIQLSEFLLFDDEDQLIDTGLAVAMCSTFGQSDDGEEAQRVLDGNPYTKFLRKDADLPVDVEVDLGLRCKVSSYGWRTADDHPARDPISWMFQIFTKHGWATLDQVALHYVPRKRHTLVGPFRLGSPFDPTIHPEFDDTAPQRPPVPVLSGTRRGAKPQGHTREQASAALNELVHSTYPRNEGWDQYHALVEDLLKAQADPNYRDERGRSTLLRACSEGDGYVIYRLLQCGGDPDRQAPTGEAPLHRCVLVGNHTNLKTVLEGGANPNIQDVQGDTPLHVAVAKVSAAAVRLLLQHHALTTTPNRRGQTPVDVLEEEMRIGVARSSPDAGEIRAILLGQTRTPIEW